MAGAPDHYVAPITNLEGTITDEGDRNMDQFLRELHTLKDQIIRGTSTAPLKTSETEDIQQKIDVLLTRLQVGNPCE